MIAEAAVPVEVNGARIVEGAFEYAARKTGTGSTVSAAARVNRGDLDAYLYFRYGLARYGASEVAAIYEGVESALLFLENRCETFPGEPVLLGLIVKRRTAALRSLVDAVSEAVTREVASRVPALASFESLVIWELIDNEQLAGRSGIAAMVSSVNEPPIKVWPL